MSEGQTLDGLIENWDLNPTGDALTEEQKTERVNNYISEWLKQNPFSDKVINRTANVLEGSNVVIQALTSEQQEDLVNRLDEYISNSSNVVKLDKYTSEILKRTL